MREIIECRTPDDLLDLAEFGDRITLIRKNSDEIWTGIRGPVLAASDVSRAVGIDLLDGASHIIRRPDGEMFGNITYLALTRRGYLFALFQEEAEAES